MLAIGYEQAWPLLLEHCRTIERRLEAQDLETTKEMAQRLYIACTVDENEGIEKAEFQFEDGGCVIVLAAQGPAVAREDVSETMAEVGQRLITELHELIQRHGWEGEAWGKEMVPFIDAKLAAQEPAEKLDSETKGK
jgi:hypothetical protein